MEKKIEPIDIQNGGSIPLNPEPTSNSKFKLQIIIGAIILLVIGLAGGWYFSQNSQEKNQDQSIIPTPTTQEAEKIDQVVATNKTIDLYGIQLYLPDGWTLTEINKRPAPTPMSELVEPDSHDCANYQIKNIPETLILIIKPTCGYSDGGADSLTVPYETVKKYNDGDLIVRFYDQTNNDYLYTSAGYATIAENNKETKTLMYGGKVTIGNNGEHHEGNLLLLTISLKYSGPDIAKEKELALADNVVASLNVLNNSPTPKISSVKTFKNSKYEFQYPADWVVIDDSGTVLIYDSESAKNPGPNFVANIFESDTLNDFTFEDPVGKKVETGDKIFVTKKENVMVDSIPVMRLSVEVMPGSATDAIDGLRTILPYNSKYLWISYNKFSNNDYEDEYEKILSSFHLVK